MNPTAVNWFCAFIGSFTALAFGSWSQLLTVFLVMIVIDYMTGILASIKEGSGLDSSVGFWGLARKALMLIVIILAHQMDLVLSNGSDVIMTGAIYFYMSNELISITENYARLGLPLPDKIRRMIAVIRDKDKPEDHENK